ncbi:hypothetical protein GGX14DRAFT_422031 [Mycena pura]|uniref:SAGA-associated factor 11 n=1 Tax=Mycena pura TaxID=153505 RepID=A0AAD6YPR2_9AGAR|nr:hypothetical protein GGX14DRAFT_422031 [Mycena pura]
MPKSQKEETLSTLATRLFNVMLEDLVMDVTLQSHHEVARSLSVCSLHCPSAKFHAPANPPVASQPPPLSRPSTPAANGSGGTGTSTPTSAKDGNLYLECLSCSRQIASNRYAPHLSSCMGLATTRRGAARGTAVKSKQPSEAEGRSTSPEADFSDDGKGKAKSKTKRPDAAEFNLKRKRASHCNGQFASFFKKQKKRPVSGSPVNRVKADSDIASGVLKSPSTSSTSKVPSKLRDSSTASLVERSVTPSSQGYSSPPADSPGASSSYSVLQSPSLNGSPVKSIRSQVPNMPPKPSPPRPVVDDYLLDDGGDETGSSTDTDSS